MTLLNSVLGAFLIIIIKISNACDQINANLPEVLHKHILFLHRKLLLKQKLDCLINRK